MNEEQISEAEQTLAAMNRKLVELRGQADAIGERLTKARQLVADLESETGKLANARRALRSEYSQLYEEVGIAKKELKRQEELSKAQQEEPSVS